MRVADFILPELGENITAGDVLRVLVKPGDTLAKDQPVVELETDKATIEVPSSVAGIVSDVKVKPGDKVKVGQVILTTDGTVAQPSAPARAAASAPPVARPAAASAPAPAPAPVEPEPKSARGGDKVVDITRGARAVAEPAAAHEPNLPPAPAAPSVRRMARELGVDINQVAGSETGGRISIDDVKAHAKRLVERVVPAAGPSAPAAPAVELPDFSRWGAIERQPMRSVRRKTAEHLTAAWTSVPHVTQHDAADITDLDVMRKRYAKQAEAAGGHLTMTAIAVKVCATALKVFPTFNASIDLSTQEIVLKKYVSIGVAVDSEQGLLVPVIRNADTKNVLQIARELTQLSEKVRTRKVALEDLQGGTFTISNLGGIGGTSFTPIVNAPEVAILGVSRARMEPVYKERGEGAGGEFLPRLMLPLSLSYDHRLIDGADGARFLRWIVDALEQPFLLALQG
jgi:pyruvate dehydrogenase E2 component (dihydrolipoamide acetyltransferase)